MFEEIISAGIVSIVVITLLVTLPGEAPIKRLLSNHAISKMFYFYTNFYLLFAVFLLFWTGGNWMWKSVTLQHYKMVRGLERRLTKLALLIVLCIPCRYILRLMTIPTKKTVESAHIPQSQSHRAAEKMATSLSSESHQLHTPASLSKHGRFKSQPLIESKHVDRKKNAPRIRDSIDMKDIRDLIFGETSDAAAQSQTTAAAAAATTPQTSLKKTEVRMSKITPFQALEQESTLYNVSRWRPIPLELFEIARLFQLFIRIQVHGRSNIPQHRPSLIVINHALGHGFDVPMMMYVLRRVCGLDRVRVLVSPKHFNYPIWCDMVYYMGGVPRTKAVTEQLMQNGETIIMFAAKKKKSSMIWDNRRHLFLDLVHKYDYVLVPAVCVSDDDVIEMVYHIDPSTTKQSKSKASNPYDTDNEETDGDDDDDDDDGKGTAHQYQSTLHTIHKRIRHGYRSQYHLRFCEAIAVPTMKPDKPLKSRGSGEYRMDGNDDDSRESSVSTPQSPLEIRFSGLDLKEKLHLDRSHSHSNASDGDYKVNDSVENVPVRKRRWSRELEIGLKNAVEDAMTDSITDVFSKLKSDPNSSLLKTMQKKIKQVSDPVYHASLKDDIRSNASNDVASASIWVD